MERSTCPLKQGVDNEQIACNYKSRHRVVPHLKDPDDQVRKIHADQYFYSPNISLDGTLVDNLL